MDPQPKFMGKTEGSGRLAGKIALITGGDSGIGRAVAVAFAKEGASVAIAYLDETEDAEKTQQVVEEMGRQCLLLPGDISQEQHCQALVEQTVSRFGRLDILVNNAAVQYPQKSIEDISSEQPVAHLLDQYFQSLLPGAFRYAPFAKGRQYNQYHFRYRLPRQQRIARLFGY